jgi:hypothetical protein
MELKVENVKHVTIAGCILHNMMIDMEKEINYSEQIELVRLQVSRSSGHSTTSGKQLRAEVAEFLYQARRRE